MKKSLYYYTSLFAWGVVFLLIVFYAFAWNPPTDNPPNANLPAPINTSSVEQTKTGNLNLGGLLRLGLLTSHPTGTNGAIYYNTTDNKFYGYQNNEWKELGSGGGASFWLASGDNIYNTNTGNVGIGTTEPTGPLEVFAEGSVKKILIRPNAAGDETNIPDQYPDSGAHWDKVDEGFPDEETIVFYEVQTGDEDYYDLYALPDLSLEGTINSVKVYIVVASYAWEESSNYAYTKIKTHDTEYTGSSNEFNDDDGFITFSTKYDNNPYTNAAWTWDEINALQVGVRLQTGDPWYSETVVFCTQVYVEVDYTPSSSVPASALLVDNSGNVGIGTTAPGAKLDVAGRIWQTGTGSSVFLGEGAGANDDLNYNHNVFIGKNAGYSNTTGYSNTAVGNYALGYNTTGQLNIAVGNEALLYNTTGYSNTAVGYSALYSNTTASGNTALGYYALNSNTTGSDNTAVGCFVLRSNTTGSDNTAVGFNTLEHSTTGYRNTALGYYALYLNTDGDDNTAVGNSALYSNTTASGNTALGYYALGDNTTGYRNTALGYFAGRYISGGSASNATSTNSLYLGYDTRALASGDTNEIVIGYQATGVGSNSVVLGNDSITKTILKGNVGIGTTDPGSYKLYVNGSFYATSKSSSAKTSKGEYLFYSEESTEHWFSDFGSSKLLNGEIKIYLDPIFQESISDKNPYVVILSPTSECNGLYVAEKNKDSFLVKELNNGQSNATFDYKIVGKRRGYEDIRLEKMEETTEK